MRHRELNMNNTLNLLNQNLKFNIVRIIIRIEAIKMISLLPIKLGKSTKHFIVSIIDFWYFHVNQIEEKLNNSIDFSLSTMLVVISRK